MGTWSQVADNLVRHKAGEIYLRAWVAGKEIRESLGTPSLRIAKLKRNERLDELREAAKKEPMGVTKVGDALTVVA